MYGNIVCVSTQCLLQIAGAVKFIAFNSIHNLGPSLSLCSFSENTDSPAVSLSTSVLTVSIKFWWMGGEMPKPETPLYIRLSYRFLYLLLFSLLFFYPVRESYILLNYPFSSVSPTAGSHRGLWTIMTNLASVIKLLILVKDMNPRNVQT